LDVMANKKLKHCRSIWEQVVGDPNCGRGGARTLARVKIDEEGHRRRGGVVVGGWKAWIAQSEFAKCSKRWGGTGGEEVQEEVFLSRHFAC